MGGKLSLWQCMFMSKTFFQSMTFLPKVRSALCEDSQLPGAGPTDVGDAPAP